jgi:predicted nucleic acid-binding protein
MVIVADTGAIISLALVDKLDLLKTLYGIVYIPDEVWREITLFIEPMNIPQVYSLQDHIRSVSGPNPFVGIMHGGEAEAACLYRELNADYLVIDDWDARLIAEANGINCIGALAVLSKARSLNLIGPLRPLFEIFVAHNRYYKKNLLNGLLVKFDEKPLDE